MVDWWANTWSFAGLVWSTRVPLFYSLPYEGFKVLLLATAGILTFSGNWFVDLPGCSELYSELLPLHLALAFQHLVPQSIFFAAELLFHLVFIS